ncbi:MAG: ABC transporter substrate-binding protein [Candidatus Bipolaricaulota bacterium]|nr:ABC transporter substrate-binding protein [Candidatus Bipolaricaulota bacterium]
MPCTRRQFLQSIGAAAGLWWLMGLTSCGPTQPSGPIKIGTLLDYTGALAEFGPPLRNSAELAAQHINDAGGLLGGRKLELVHEDAATNPSVALDRAKKLIEIDKVPAIVGALASGVTVPVAQTVTIPNRVLLISPASTSPLLTHLPEDEGKDLLFRTCPSDALQGIVLGKLAAELGYATAAVLYVNNPYGQGLKDEFKRSFERHGGRVVSEAAHPEEVQPSYVAELRQLTEAQPDVLVAIGYPGHATIYLKEALEGGYAKKFLFVDGTKSEKIIEAVGAENLEGMYGTAPGSEKTSSLEIFNAEYQRVYKEVPPQPFMANAYDAVIVLALAMQRAGKADSLAMRDALRSVANPPGEIVSAGAEGMKRAFQLLKENREIDYEGAAGAVNFDAHGDVITPIEIWQYTSGTIQTVRLEMPTE